MLAENHHVCLILLRAARPECEVLRQLHEVVDQLHDPLEVIPKGILGGRGVETMSLVQDAHKQLLAARAFTRHPTTTSSFKSLYITKQQTCGLWSTMSKVLVGLCTRSFSSTMWVSA